MFLRLLFALLIGVFVSAPLAAPAQPRGAMHDRHFQQVSGVIASASGGSFKLRGGPVVFLKSGTVISPRGTTLRRGMRVSVNGTPAGNGNINAVRVNVSRR